jgi:predicted amidophosphoribosyltransferase
MPPRKAPKAFGSFGDLLDHQKKGRRRADLKKAAELLKAGEPEQASSLLATHDLSGEAAADRIRFGQCFAGAAKAAIARQEWQIAEQRLRQALNLGYHQWHLHRRLELLEQVRTGRLKYRLEEGDWIERAMTGCRKCVPDPQPLDCAKCLGILKPPCKPVYQDNLDALFSLGVYRWQGDPDSLNPLSRMIRWLKRRDGKEACKYLGYLLVQGLRRDTHLLARADCIVPVPADPTRLRQRGFDNILEIACAMESFSLVSLARETLVKTRPTEDLRRLSWSERATTLAGSFEVAAQRKHLLDGAAVLLVDDVVTSGTTLDLCAGLLLDAGARSVFAATLARSESTPASEKFA